MDPITIESFTKFLDFVNTGGVTALLSVLIVLFIRGDIIPRKVYERMLRDTLTKIASDIIASVTALLKDQTSYNDKQIDELSRRFNHIEECIEQVRNQQERGKI